MQGKETLSPLCLNSCVRNNVDFVLFVSGDACYKSQETESTLFLCISKEQCGLSALGLWRCIYARGGDFESTLFSMHV